MLSFQIPLAIVDYKMNIKHEQLISSHWNITIDFKSKTNEYLFKKLINYSALILGFIGSFHCIGMCGPIAFALPINRKNNIKKIALIFLYYFGRLLSYSFISFIFGFLLCGMVYMALVGAIATSNSLYGDCICFYSV